MDTKQSINYDTILPIITNWSPSERIVLLQDVLKTLNPTPEPMRPHRRTLDKALGLLATDQPPPTDEEVQQWLDEHRMEKYG